MEFSLDPELRDLRARVRALVDDHLMPLEQEAERNHGRLSEESYARAHALGISNALPEIEVDRDHPQLREVAAAHLPAALIFGGSAATLHPATN